MQHSAVSKLHSTETVTLLLLRATGFKATIKQKFIHRGTAFFLTCQMMSQKFGYPMKNVYSALCCIARSPIFDTYFLIALRIRNRIQKYFRVLIRGLGSVDIRPEVENLMRLSL
jgi:hypothetical protein